MPVLRDVSVELTLDEVVRAQGIRDYARLKPVMKTTIDEMTALVAGGDDVDGIFEPAIAYQIYPVVEITDSHLALAGTDTVLQGSVFQRVIANAVQVAVVTCTIGPRLEERVAGYFREGESLRGLLLDGIGSAAAGAVGAEACRRINALAEERGLDAASPVSPGGPRFPISQQWPLFSLIPAAEIGVRLSGSGLMMPRKSLSRVIGLGHDMRIWTTREGCDHCNLSKTCAYRSRV